MSENLNNLPFQITSLIENMMNKEDSAHIRGNYRMRLDSIRDAINIYVKKFDDEMTMTNPNMGRKKRG